MDGKGRYILLDARTGAQILHGEAEEAGTQGCATTGISAHHLWLGPKGKVGVLFDVAAPRATSAPRPAACTAGGRPLPAPTATRTTLPWDAGAMVKLVTLREGQILVALGINNWTKKVVTVAGFGPTSIDPLWRRPMRAGMGEAPPFEYEVPGEASPVDLVAGRVYAAYPIRIDQAPWLAWRMQAFTAATGGELWDVPLESSGLSGVLSTPELMITETRVYVAYEQWLQIHARDSGERLRRIGP
jgi:hypothetical protein